MKLVPVILEPHQLGWMRRPEMEQAGYMYVWELPDGQIVRFPWGMPRKITKLVASDHPLALRAAR